MNVTQKLALLYGSPGVYVGYVPAAPELGLPPVNLEDGPQGVADGTTEVTAWPSALTVAMSWDRDAMYAFGRAMAEEQAAKGTNVLLGPGVNLARVPWSGRVFEYISGEDAYLGAQLVGPEIAGIQSIPGMAACVKHYAANVIEDDRSGMNVAMSEALWMDVYSRVFQAAVDAGVGTAMCAYNRLQIGPNASSTAWSCENPDTLGYIYGPGGFQGWMMSDWGATHSTVPAALAGLTQQMPDSTFFGAALAAAVAAGQVSEAQVDTMAARVLVPMFALGMVDNPPTGNILANATSLAHVVLARQLAENATVLLKNDPLPDGSGRLLPLDPSTFKRVLVLGDQTTVLGHGSGGVIPNYISVTSDGLSLALNGPPPPRALNCSYVNNTDFYQPLNPCVMAASAADCCARCTANAYGTPCNAFTFVAGAICEDAPTAAPATARPRRAALKAAAMAAAGGGTCWLKPDASGATPATGKVSGTCAPQPAPTGPYTVTYNGTQDAAAAAALAVQYDVVIMHVAVTSGEGSDRANISLPWWQDAMVAAVAAANPRTAVVARCAGACAMPWAGDVSAILYQLLPGQEAGNAAASVLLGAVNPSGKLPLSLPANMTDTWLGSPAVNPAQYPGVVRPGDSFPTATLSEGQFFGYRWYDANPGFAPDWHFGHGLSYTAFSYGAATVSGAVSPGANASATIAFALTNAGAVAGSEVPQLYIGWPADAPGGPRPVRQLRGFTKVRDLAPGASVEVAFTLGPEDVRIWDDEVTHDWAVVPGTYPWWVGSSSADLRLAGSFAVTA